MTDLLTPHFLRREFTVSEVAARRGLPNEPGPEEWRNLEELAWEVLEPARDALGPIRINSGFRSPLVNRAVGGAPGSQHMKGEAGDIIPLAVSLRRLYEWIRDNTPFDQIIWEFNEWVHVSHRRLGPQRGIQTIAARGNGQAIYRPMPADFFERTNGSDRIA